MGSENNMVAANEREEIAYIIRSETDFDHPDQGHYLRAADRILACLAQPDAQQGASSPASGEGVEAVAYLHTLHMEGGQTYDRLTLWNGIDEDEPRRTAFGFPERDYSPEYHVTTTPLYATPLAAATQPAVPQEDAVERAARAMCEADGLDPDEEIVGGQATGFENYGPLWQAEDRSEGQLGLTNYKRLARAALTGAGENGEQGA